MPGEPRGCGSPSGLHTPPMHAVWWPRPPSWARPGPTCSHLCGHWLPKRWRTMTDLCKVHGAGASRGNGGPERMPICFASASQGACGEALVVLALGWRGLPWTSFLPHHGGWRGAGAQGGPHEGPDPGTGGAAPAVLPDPTLAYPLLASLPTSPPLPSVSLLSALPPPGPSGAAEGRQGLAGRDSPRSP